MKKGRISLIFILAILLLIIGVGYYLIENGIIDLFGKNTEQIIYDENDLFFVSKQNEKIGIVKSDGNIILESKYDVLLRNGQSVYVKDDTDSYVFFLDNNKSISLGGKENDVMLVYNKTTFEPLPYFILVYGHGDSAVYRIFKDDGVRYSSKDFTKLAEVQEFLDAKTTFKSISAPKNILELYVVDKTLSYSTDLGRTQYVVSKKTDSDKQNNKKYGIVDETGRVILDIACTSIEEVESEVYNGVLVSKNDKEYIFLNTEKLIEVDSGFEFAIKNEYIFQKKGDIVNKVYNFEGEVVIDGIYSYSKDFINMRSNNGISYVLLQENGAHELYNIETNKKYEALFNGVISKYFEGYTPETWITGFMFVDNGVPGCVDFSTMKQAKINVVQEIQSVLDIGCKYTYKD